MKTSFAAVAVVALGLAGNEAAKGSGGNASSNSAPAPHHGSASSPATTTTTVTPRFSGGVPHYSGAMPYRPTVNYQNGNRRLNYPPVAIPFYVVRCILARTASILVTRFNAAAAI